MREIASRILGILPLDTEFIANATRTTYKQLYWSYRELNFPGYEEVVGEALVAALKGMRDAVRKHHNYYLLDY